MLDENYSSLGNVLVFNSENSYLSLGDQTFPSRHSLVHQTTTLSYVCLGCIYYVWLEGSENIIIN